MDPVRHAWLQGASAASVSNSHSCNRLAIKFRSCLQREGSQLGREILGIWGSLLLSAAGQPERSPSAWRGEAVPE